MAGVCPDLHPPRPDADSPDVLFEAARAVRSHLAHLLPAEPAAVLDGELADLLNAPAAEKK